MSLSSGTLQGLIDAALQGDGANGPNRTNFSGAVARGIVNYLVGKQFQTQDTGDGTGGTGTGVGILGLSSSNMASISLAAMSSQGPKASSFWNAIMGAVKSHLESATLLTTVDPDVGQGAGVVIIGSFVITVSGLQGSIDSELVADGASGYNRPNFSFACAKGIVEDILATGTGNTTISGPVLPPGTSGIGNGTLS